METALLILTGAGIAVVCVLYGRKIADDDWLLSAAPRRFGRAAHCCRGRFFYVIPEHEFVTDYVRRDLQMTKDESYSVDDE